MSTRTGSAGREPFRDTELQPGDAAEALGLSAEAGWNQTEADWRLLLLGGGGLAVRDGSDRLAATIVTLDYARVGWLAMLLVRLDSRGSGLGTRLLDQALEALHETGRTAGLDATPQGRNIYERCGFRAAFELQRLSLEHPSGAFPARSSVRAGENVPQPVPAELLQEMILRDSEVLGFDRSSVFRGIAEHAATIVTFDPEETGSFALLRPGRTANQIGPIYSRTLSAAVRMTESLLLRIPGEPVFIDVPAGQSGFLRRLESAGFRHQRPFTRMYRDSLIPPGRPDELFAITGPEFG